MAVDWDLYETHDEAEAAHEADQRKQFEIMQAASSIADLPSILAILHEVLDPEEFDYRQGELLASLDRIVQSMKLPHHAEN